MATVSVTFDNLGEAADLERGIWPEDQRLGEHFTVREALPQLLSLLAGADLRATFFVEGLNGELYPEALAGCAPRDTRSPRTAGATRPGTRSTTSASASPARATRSAARSASARPAGS